MIPGSNVENSSRLLVVGGETAKGLATHLADEWHVRLLSDDETIVDTTDPDSFEAFAVDFEVADLERHAADADTAIVVTEHDRVGLLVTQVLDAICGVDSILTRVDDPENRSAFEGIDCETIETAPLFRPQIERKLGSDNS